MKRKKSISGNQILLSGLNELGIKNFFGVNGGSILHLLNYINDAKFIDIHNQTSQKFITISEYAAGFAPIGHYLASGQIAAAVATTGAAQKLITCGLSDAKYMNVPVLYILGLNNYKHLKVTPLQDVSKFGMNIIEQIKREIGDGVVVLEKNKSINECLDKISNRLKKSLPAVLAFYPDYLNALNETLHSFKPITFNPKNANNKNISQFVKFIENQHKRRIIVYVGFEAARYPGIKKTINDFCSLLKSPTVWTVNGANAVAHSNSYGYGHIILGGNTEALKLWNSLNKNDVLICLGLDAGEYTLNLEKISCGDCWYLSGLEEVYGQHKNTFKIRFSNNYHEVKGNIVYTLKTACNLLRKKNLDFGAGVHKPKVLNASIIYKGSNSNCVDLVEFYKNMNSLWRKNSIVFEDTCSAYTDRQRVIPKPNPNVKFFTAHQGSAMGGAFGLAVGAKYANPNSHCFIFSGDGCWRLFSGNLIDFSYLKLVLFILNNGSFSIVHKGLNVIIPGSTENEQHCQLAVVDFIAAAKANNWDAVKLSPDLSNLESTINTCYEKLTKSILIEIPADPDQIIGTNPRYAHLKTSIH